MDQKKSRYTPAQKKAAEKYLSEKVEDIRIRVPKGSKQRYKDAASAAGKSLNQFAVDALEEKIKRQDHK